MAQVTFLVKQSGEVLVNPPQEEYDDAKSMFVLVKGDTTMAKRVSTVLFNEGYIGATGVDIIMEHAT